MQSPTKAKGELYEKRREAGKNSLNVAYATEEKVVNILSGFDNVSSVWKDRYNSKFDIFYILKNESVTRGLQVKTIIQLSPTKPRQFRINALDKYEDGMLMVALKHLEFGLVYVNSREYSIEGVTISLRKPAKTKFNKLILDWDEFLGALQNSLSKGIIVTTEVYEKSLGNCHLKEYQSIERFTILCRKYGLTIEVNNDTTSATDLIVSGFKVQMKYCGRVMPSRQKSRHNAYTINLYRSGLIKYKKGDNDFYIIELGANHGDFMWIPEHVLIKMGYISENNLQEKRKVFNLYPHDHVEKRREVSRSHKNNVKGSWSCDPKFWISTERGCLGSLENVDVHIKNLFLDPSKEQNTENIIVEEKEEGNQ